MPLVVGRVAPRAPLFDMKRTARACHQRSNHDHGG